jgi:AcrR family transcriptional regulator
MLIRKGIGAVKVERLAAALKCSRGAFYNRFRGHSDLIDALLADWRDTNGASMMAALQSQGTAQDRIRALFVVWADQAGYDPDHDVAVRAWSATSAKVAKAVRAVDEQRLEALRQVFLDAGYQDLEAVVRARVLYFHQIGRLATDVRGERSEYRARLQAYCRVLTGF